MKRGLKLYHIAVVVYILVVTAFVMFFVYMGICEHVSVENVRNVHDYQCIQNYEVKEFEDASAPIGMRREYRWILDEIHSGNEVLAFYTVHQYVQVYIEDELIYSILPAEGNRVGKTTGSNWAEIPLYETDNGKEVCVVITPVYESVRNRSIRFEISSPYRVFRSQFTKNLIQLILAGTCFVLSLFIMLVQVFLIWQKKTRSWDIFFLGNATMLIGLWKITDTAFAPLVFEQNTKALGFVVIGILFLVTIPLALFLSGRFRDYHEAPMLVVSLLTSGAAGLALILQIVGVADFKELLPLAHGMILLSAICLVILALLRKRHGKGAKTRQPVFFSAVLFLGAALDLFLFYRNGSSADIGYTLFAILIYTMGLFTVNILETGRRAYTDAFTGLFNKSRWEALMDQPEPVQEPISLMMLDLNGLKHINDTMGHEAGDKMIYSFANILRNTIPPSNTICRWGGDEFAVMFVNANEKIIEQYAEGICTAVERYNASGEKPELQYAMGYVLSDEFPELSRRELLRKADERMYQNKQKWYTKNHITKNGYQR